MHITVNSSMISFNNGDWPCICRGSNVSKHRSEDLVLAKKVDCKFNQGDQPDKKRCDRQDWAVHCLGNTDQVAGTRESLVVFDKQSSSVKHKIVKRKIKIHVYAKR